MRKVELVANCTRSAGSSCVVTARVRCLHDKDGRWHRIKHCTEPVFPHGSSKSAFCNCACTRIMRKKLCASRFRILGASSHCLWAGNLSSRLPPRRLMSHSQRMVGYSRTLHSYYVFFFFSIVDLLLILFFLLCAQNRVCST
jgi:hypothetical protein